MLPVHCHHPSLEQDSAKVVSVPSDSGSHEEEAACFAAANPGEAAEEEARIATLSPGEAEEEVCIATANPEEEKEA